MIDAYRSRPVHRVVGLISGTSADGIDAALVEFSPGPRLVRFLCKPYPPAVRQRIFALMENRADVVEVARMNVLLGRLFAEAARDVSPERPDLVASHGQTIAHLPVETEYCGYPVRCTLQIGEAAELAARVGCPVASDFRPADVALGGQGAPLVPFADALLLRDPEVDRAALNIGGIANLTWIPREGPVRACDTGPGNCLMDALAERAVGRPCDLNGELAAKGRVIPEILEELLSHPYFALTGPRSTGREAFGRPLADRLWGRAEPADLVRTAAALTAETIARGLRAYFSEGEVVAGGGGVDNPVLMGELAARLPERTRLRRFDEFGIPAEAREAVAFAILGHHTMLGLPSNVPGATGATRPAVLGKLSLPPVSEA
ncbi:MAG: anhydro-N-acetylmuramic acid kinase [Candidatus Eremiobacterota bacterium]